MASRKTIGRDSDDESAWRQFAAAALGGNLARTWNVSEEITARSAAKIADLMLEEFQRRTPNS